MQLTDAEKQMAHDAGISLDAFALVKTALNPQINLVELGVSETEFLSESSLNAQQLLPEDKAIYSEIEKQFPELKPLVDATLAPMRAMAGMGRARAAFELLFRACNDADAVMQARIEKFYESTKDCWYLLKQDAIAKSVGQPEGALLMTLPNSLDSDEALAAAVKDVRDYAAIIAKEYPTSAFCLGLRFSWPGDALVGKDPRVAELNKQLKDHNCQIIPKGITAWETRWFDQLADAETYLKQAGYAADRVYMNIQDARKFELIYPIKPNDLTVEDNLEILAIQTIDRLTQKSGEKLASAVQDLKNDIASKGIEGVASARMSITRLQPGSTVSKLGTRRWAVEVPYRCSARLTPRQAFLKRICSP